MNVHKTTIFEISNTKSKDAVCALINKSLEKYDVEAGVKDQVRNVLLFLAVISLHKSPESFYRKFFGFIQQFILYCRQKDEPQHSSNWKPLKHILFSDSSKEFEERNSFLLTWMSADKQISTEIYAFLCTEKYYTYVVNNDADTTDESSITTIRNIRICDSFQISSATFTKELISFQHSSSFMGCLAQIYCNDSDNVYEECSLIQDFLNHWKPHVIAEYLDENVIAQKDATRAVSILVYNHFQRLLDDSLDKGSLLIMGPSGSGKTELFRQLKKIPSFPIPVTVIDSTALSATGFKGLNISSLFASLAKEWENYNYPGIVVFDEIDKICVPSITSDGEDYNKQIQAALLKGIEDGEIRNDDGKVVMDTKHTTFAFAGAFSGLQLEQKDMKTIGFGATTSHSEKNKQLFLQEQLTNYGMSPELLSRIGGEIVVTSNLNEDDYFSILNSPEGEIQKLRKRMSLDHLSLVIEEDCLRHIIRIGQNSELGVRGINGWLRTIVNRKYFDVLKDGNSTVVSVEKKDVDSLSR